MQNLGGLATGLAVAALGVGGYALFHVRSQPDDVDVRVERLEVRLARIEDALARRPLPGGETLEGARAPSGGPELLTTPAPADAPTEQDAAPSAARADGVPSEETAEALQALVDQAVEKKATQLQQMRNKKPPIDAFAKTLELTDEQRRSVEREVRRGQREIAEILETPTDDGTVLMDDLVETLALGIAKSAEAGPRWAKFIGRVMAEKVPGTDETYGARIEAVKGTVRAAFKRDWSAKQYAAFEAWQMDPTEIQGIEGSAYKRVEARVMARAKQLGAELPDDG